MAISFVLGDQRYTGVYIDRPDNPKPARFSERAQAALADRRIHLCDGRIAHEERA